MRHFVEMIIYEGEKGKPMTNVIRETKLIGYISPEDFNVHWDSGTVFMYPQTEDGQPPQPGVYVWHRCTPESEEETKKLIEMGKWGKTGSITI